MILLFLPCIKTDFRANAISSKKRQFAMLGLCVKCARGARPPGPPFLKCGRGKSGKKRTEKRNIIKRVARVHNSSRLQYERVTRDQYRQDARHRNRPECRLNIIAPLANSIGVARRVLVLGDAAFAAPGADSGDLGVVPLLLRAVGPRGQLDEGVQRDRHPGRVGLRLLHEVGVDAAQHGLVRDDQDVLRPLKLHDDGLQADHHVAIPRMGWLAVGEIAIGDKNSRLATSVAVVVLVVIARCKVLGIQLRDLLVGQAVANSRVKLIQRLPLQLVIGLGEEASGCDGTSQSGGPDCERAIVLGKLAYFILVDRGHHQGNWGSRTPTDSRTSSGSFLAYISPRAESTASPPILPSRLNSDSPC